MKILCIGEEWRGSNAAGLFYALSRIGCQVQIINEQKYISTSSTSFVSKVLNYSIRPFQVNDFNQQLIHATQLFKPNVILVYKGTFVESDTIMQWKNMGLPVINFFPDVSFLAHGKRIPKCIPLYNHIFSTKTFASSDLQKNFNFSPGNVTFIPHGFDPQVHRKMELNSSSEFLNQVSFIGNYSPHKAEYLSVLKGFDLKIWGGTWKKHFGDGLQRAIQGAAVSGDLYALAINSSTINLALLSEKVQGASHGDQITSRSFHIPAAGGFMLHERTDEIKNYFEEGKEMDCFSSAAEMREKVKYYLEHESERKRIQEKGYERACRDHSLDERAKSIVKVLKEKFG